MMMMKNTHHQTTYKNKRKSTVINSRTTAHACREGTKNRDQKADLTANESP